MMKTASLCVLVLLAGVAQASTVTGDPIADGWAFSGNSLDNGIYVRGSANYGYDAYGAGFTIAAGSNLVGDTWQAGDTVLAVGGVFQAITAEDAGWTAFSGNSVNSLLGSTTNGPKLQAKFGNAAAAWTTSTIAPGGGDGLGSLGYGDGDLVNGVAIQIRTGTGYYIGGPAFVPGQDQAGYLGWDTNAGMLMHLAKDSHITWSVSSTLVDMDKDVARMIWSDVSATGEPASWELLLNVSLIDRLNPGYAGLLPAIGDDVLMTVQDNDAAYTDALVSTVPEPATMAMLALGGLMLRRRK
jgi:hypothetical protein